MWFWTRIVYYKQTRKLFFSCSSEGITVQCEYVQTQCVDGPDNLTDTKLIQLNNIKE